MPEQLVEIEATPYSGRAVRKSRLKEHAKWPEIHEAIVTSPLSAAELCVKFDLRTKNGAWAIKSVAKYRARILDQFKDLFEKGNELENHILRHEILKNFRHVFQCAAEGHEMAKSQEKIVGRGKNAKVVMAPDFPAMKEQQDSMAAVTQKLAELAGIGANAPQKPAPMYQDNRTLQILALPKSDGVPSRPPVKVIASKSA